MSLLDFLNSGLEWKRERLNYEYAIIGEHSAGNVVFHLERQPSCQIRGQFKLIIETHGHEFSFDYDDQPMRYYHNYKAAKDEAFRIASALMRDYVHKKAQNDRRYEDAQKTELQSGREGSVYPEETP